MTVQDAGRALGASIAALGLSNKAVYDEDADGDGGAVEQPEGHHYPDGPDIAPESAPSVVAGAAVHFAPCAANHPTDGLALSVRASCGMQGAGRPESPA